MSRSIVIILAAVSIAGFLLALSIGSWLATIGYALAVTGLLALQDRMGAEK